MTHKLLHFCPHELSNYSGQFHIWTQGAVEQQSSAFSCLSLTFFKPPFLTLYLSFSPSLPRPISLDFFLPPSLPPSVLYGKTFLVFYSAPVKPGAYFQCPKLIANVRTDPSSRSLFPPSIPPLPPPHHHPLTPSQTSSLFGINSEDTWNIFCDHIEPWGFMFLKVFPFYIRLHVFLLNFWGAKVYSLRVSLRARTES